MRRTVAGELAGSPSEEIADILETGRSGITRMFVSMSQRHPYSADAEYLRWHTLDHRPEQHRLAGVRSSLRLVSTPACRAARAASDPMFDGTDHVMTYFFADEEGLLGFDDLAVALANVGRIPFLLPAVQRGVYSDVLPDLRNPGGSRRRLCSNGQHLTPAG